MTYFPEIIGGLLVVGALFAVCVAVIPPKRPHGLWPGG